MTATTEKHRASACCFNAEIEIDVDRNGEGSKTAPFKMRARSGGAIEHPYWGSVVHDFAGMQLAKNRIPIDYNHNSNEVVGFGNRFDTDSGDLEIRGALTAFNEQDRAAEVIWKSGEGVPYEASIFFGGDGIEIERLPASATEFVNGREVSGPATIIRKWPLRGAAVTPYGQDANTSTEFGSEVEVSVTVKPERKDTEMAAATEEKPEAVDAQAVEASQDQDRLETDEDRKVESPPVVEKPHTELSRKDHGRTFIEAFGLERGSQYFTEGLSFEQATVAHMAYQTARIAELEKKLGAVAMGEETPAEFSARDGVKKKEPAVPPLK